MLLLVVASSREASAHVSLESPTSRYGASVLKVGPCGMAGGQRTENVTTFAPGETIVVRWDEYINHPAHYRIAFDVEGDDDFRDPICTSDCDTTHPTFEFYTDSTILLDNIPDGAGGEQSVEVTLPNVTCDRCTLQLIQVMYDKPPYTQGGNDVYYQCADLVLTPAAATDGGVLDAGSSGDAATVDASAVGSDDASDALRTDGASSDEIDGGTDGALSSSSFDGGAGDGLSEGDSGGGCSCETFHPSSLASRSVVGTWLLSIVILVVAVRSRMVRVPVVAQRRVLTQELKRSAVRGRSKG